VRVLMLSKALVVGAYQKKLEEMARRPGIELTVVVPPYWREGHHRLGLQRLYTSGYDLLETTMALNGHYHLHFYPHLPSIVRKVRPDIFHIDEEPYNHVTLQAMALGRSVRARCLFFTWQNIFHPQPWNLVERYNLSHADAAIAGNSEAADVLRRKGFAQPIAIIPQFGVDPAVYRPIEKVRQRRQDLLPFAVSGRTFVIGYVGRLVEQKGLLTLLHAVASLEGEWQLLLIGNGELRPDIERLAARLDCSSRLHIIDAVPSHHIPDWLNVIDCLVLPSLTRRNWKEQFGRVLIEAMACQVPVVGSDSGEIPNVIADTGLIAQEGNVEQLRQHIARLMTDRELARRLGEMGRQRVLAYYTQARVAEATCHFYDEILGLQPAHGGA